MNRKLGSATRILLEPNPEMDERIVEWRRNDKIWFLSRLEQIEKRYHTREINRFISDVWRRISVPGFDDWTEKNIREFSILDRIDKLDKEIVLARESINGGDTLTNKHFRHVQQLDDTLGTVLKPLMSLGVRNALSTRRANNARSLSASETERAVISIGRDLRKRHPGWLLYQVRDAIRRQLNLVPGQREVKLPTVRTYYTRTRFESDNPPEKLQRRR